MKKEEKPQVNIIDGVLRGASIVHPDTGKVEPLSVVIADLAAKKGLPRA